MPMPEETKDEFRERVVALLRQHMNNRTPEQLLLLARLIDQVEKL